jgi:hypothetical protein
MVKSEKLSDAGWVEPLAGPKLSFSRRPLAACLKI